MLEHLIKRGRKALSRVLGPDIEQAFQRLQADHNKVRHSTAQAIVVEKQLAMQLQKNQDQARVWQDRADQLAGEGNDELSQEALQRKVQYVQAADALVSLLETTRESNLTLRQSLHELESIVTRIFVVKSLLVVLPDFESRISELYTRLIGAYCERLKKAFKTKREHDLEFVQELKGRLDELESKSLAACSFSLSHTGHFDATAINDSLRQVTETLNKQQASANERKEQIAGCERYIEDAARDGDEEVFRRYLKHKQFFANAESKLQPALKALVEAKSMLEQLLAKCTSN
jgi:phage shock protein A